MGPFSVQDPQTDWFKGYGFLHFQPLSMKCQDVKKQSSFDYPVKIKSNNNNQEFEQDELERFAVIRHHPVHDVKIPSTPNMKQLQLSDLDTPYLPSASKIKVQCRVEISQSNSS
jgi:hypothetical protein